MADLWIGLDVGQIDGMSDQLTVSTSSTGQDIEVHIVNGTTAGGPKIIDINKALELITWYLINHGVDFNATPTTADL
ncbi:MAG TPA: hypothetical protein VKT80_07725 [Chloroflexota bacterium]|nr:hypothetical protein [Chloroflexota bacterium]